MILQSQKNRPKKFGLSGILFLGAMITVSDVFAHGISESDKQSMLDGGYLEYIWLGAVHMLTGYDHLLFLFGVIFFLISFKDIVKFITAFTIGHSITLIFATLFKITANYYLVDAVIALSVCYKGFDNLDGFKKYLKMEAPNLLFVVFIFGLIHGFGLSTRLQRLPLGEDMTGLVLRILSFNVGVEVGQITALVIMLLVISGWRKSTSFFQFSKVSNVGLIAAGVVLFFMQMHGFSHRNNPDEFPMNKDDHYHTHLSMEEKRKENLSDGLMQPGDTGTSIEPNETQTTNFEANPKHKTHSHGGKSHTH